MTKRELVNKARCIAALEQHWSTATKPWRGAPRVEPGPILYGLLDAAFGKLKPSQADAGRANAMRWLRRRAQGRLAPKSRKSPAKQRRGAKKAWPPKRIARG